MFGCGSKLTRSVGHSVGMGHVYDRLVEARSECGFLVLPEICRLRPFTISLARHIGRGQFDEAINELRAALKGNASDVASLEMIAQCHYWSGRADQAISACQQALKYDPDSFDAHALLSQLHAARNEHENAATHARRGLECYPEPLPRLPSLLDSAHTLLSRIIPLLRGAPTPNEALQSTEAEHAEWYDWAKKYLDWYDATSGEAMRPRQH